MKRIILFLLIICLISFSCKKQNNNTNNLISNKIKEDNIKLASFKISGMTCEIGCAKSIVSKLSKIDGVVNANIIFKDSIANVKFDKTKTNVKKLMTFVDGISNGIYKIYFKKD